MVVRDSLPSSRERTVLRHQRDGYDSEIFSMTTKQIRFQDLPTLVGQEVGVSDWYLVTQQAVDACAAATDDRQWFCHVGGISARALPMGAGVMPRQQLTAKPPSVKWKI